MASNTWYISADANDGFCQNGTAKFTGYNDTYLGRWYSNNYHAFFRFLNVTIAQGSTINSAKLTVTASDNTSGASANTIIYGEKATNPSAPSDCSDLGGRTYTDASVAWAMPSFTTDTQYDTNDITDIVQEIVSQVGFASGNAMQFFINDNSAGDTGYRKIYQYYGGGTSHPVELYVDYTEPAGTPIGAISMHQTGHIISKITRG